MKFLVPNYSCLQNPWLGGYHTQIPVLSVLNWICWTPSPPHAKKISGYATACYHSTLMSLSGFVKLCSLLIFRIAAISEICNVNHFCSKPSVKPQHRKNEIFCRNRKASYESTGRHCMSSKTHRRADTRQSLGTEHLWTVRPRNDVRTMRTGLLQTNAASVCYWHTIHCYLIVVFSCLNLHGCFM